MHHLSDLKGQPRARSILEAYLQKTPPPLLILSGPAGTGKHSAAEIFVQSHFCDTGSACGQCGPCRRMLKGEHPDYIRFPEDRIKIGDRRKPEDFTIRWLISTRLPYRPHEAPFRFVLFPDASLIQDEAETSLLKTLEEPPEHTRFIFLVRDVSELKPTILSRGLLVPFQLLDRVSLTEVSGVDSPDLLDLLAGSLENLEFFQSELYRSLKSRVADTSSRPGLLELEKWMIDLDRGGAEKMLGAPIESMRLWSLLVLVWLRHLNADVSGNLRRLTALLDFQGDLRSEMPGFQSYAISRMFHRMACYTEGA
ncbi:MAG: hypothetical protein K1X70_00805 [Leptospirales bacterium]|nr:hypothetical protein [Leptospirales bacterium]HNJ35867.1 hypothetical protein [Leptospiraceae bacterium]